MSRPLGFREIEALRALMISGTTVAAARMLNTTQPSISRLLSQARLATGLQLFSNERGRLQPTREAQHLFDAIQRHFHGIEKIEQTVAALRESGTGLLRIACTPTLALGVLPGVVERFSKDWPNVRVHLQTLGTPQIRDGAQRGLYDIAITNNGLGGNEFLEKEIHQSTAVCVMALRHPLAECHTIDARDLQNHPLICLDAPDSLDRELHERLARRKVVALEKVTTTYSATICVFAAQGIGLGIVSPYIASVFKDRLAIRRFTPQIKVSTFASMARYTSPSELSGKFLDTITKYMRASDWMEDNQRPAGRASR